VILSYNRCAALQRTLTELATQGLLARAQVIVVDNASSDGSVAMVRAEFPAAHVVEVRENLGVGAFNLGVQQAKGELILILDDDSWPDPAALASALKLMEQSRGIAAVALLPKHPSTLVEEWRHENGQARSGRGGWPIMGCGNLIRTDAWRAVGGYESAFFLYRNDTDLALKLLSAGYDVWFDPTWIVWHDSPAAAVKSERWLYYATRNWGWLAKRHGRGATRVFGMLAGFLWAAKLAGLSPRRQWRALSGAVASVLQASPPLPASCNVDGKAFASLVRRQCTALGSSRG
jgi:GT2 family glycosyltransferase